MACSSKACCAPNLAGWIGKGITPISVQQKQGALRSNIAYLYRRGPDGLGSHRTPRLFPNGATRLPVSHQCSSEQDHRRVKGRLRPMLGFKTFYNARRAIIGIELARKIHKRQFAIPITWQHRPHRRTPGLITPAILSAPEPREITGNQLRDQSLCRIYAQEAVFFSLQSSHLSTVARIKRCSISNIYC